MYVPSTTGILDLAGDTDRLLTLAPSTESGIWTLKVGTGASISVKNVDVSMSKASGLSITAENSVGDDYSKENGWLFPVPAQPGDPLTWTGGGDTSWVNPENWLDKYSGNRAPEETDVITIPAGCPRYPVVVEDTLVNSLVIEAGATNKLSGADFTVTNGFSSAGVVICAAASKLIIAGEGNATLDFGGLGYDDVHITKSGGTVAFPNGFSAKRLKISTSAPTTFLMPAGQKVVAGVFDVDGTDDDFITFASSSPGTAWKLQVDDVMRVRGVAVSDSDAADGRTVAAGIFAADNGRNLNWDFSSAAASEWVGGVDSKWTTAGNWTPEGVPGETAVVAIRPKSADVSVTLSTNIVIVPVGGLMIGDSDYAATLHCDKAIEVASGVDVAENATLVLNSIATNNIVNSRMVVRKGAVITHTGPQSSHTQLYGINLLVKDDVFIENGGAINADGKGFRTGYGPGRGNGNGSSTANPSHGGIGYINTYKCYGSIFRPCMPGSPYTSGGGNSSGGGGQVSLTVEGDLTLEGSITADGGSSGGGSGGSVWLTAERLLGTGRISASGASAGYGAAGGRIALYQTVATSLGFNGSISYAAANPTGRVNGNGTRYYQNAGSEDGAGTVYFYSGSGGTEFPMSADGDARSAYSKATIRLGSGKLYVLADTKVKDLIVTGGTIDLQGYTIRVLSRTHKDGKGWSVAYDDCVTENGGKIVWVNGMSIAIR